MNMTPQEIVDALDRYIIGQDDAKRAVAVALRNRFRRSQLTPEMQDEVMPKNILMIGSTGVGKTEIARRLAKLSQAPFVKVEATKFTEVGYVGRDVESIVRDLTEASVRMVKAEKMDSVKDAAAEAVEDRILQALLPMPGGQRSSHPFGTLFRPTQAEESPEDTKWQETQGRIKTQREELRKRLRGGEFEERLIELELEEAASSMSDVFSGSGLEDMGIQMQDLLGGLLPKKKKHKKVTVRQARELLQQEEAAKLLDMDAVTSEAVARAENHGIIFIDELDKVASQGKSSGPDISREGVQRDILPIVEGSTVVTKYGPVKTNHMLFIAAGAFHIAKPADLIPELQGRFPIRVELQSLSKHDFERILTEPKNALLKQYQALLAVEGVDLQFTPAGIRALAATAEQANQEMENIGARRLHTILERVLETIAFEAGVVQGTVTVDENFVEDRLGAIRADQDLAKYIL